MKTILLPFYDDDASQNAFDLASRLVRRTKGYLEGLFVLRRPQLFDSESDVVADSYFTQLAEESRNIADQVHARFHACSVAHGLVAAETAAADGPSAGWREIEGTEDQVIGNHGRLFDLIMVAREFAHPWLKWRALLESALFDSGRPVMLTPQTRVATAGENVVIAWNSSTETARTVALAKPLLAHARAVTVLSVEGWGVPGPSGKMLADYLVRAGVPATARTVPSGGRAPAEAVLAECTRCGADLLVKGAYTQSRLRQIIFGGATRHVIAHAQLPVLLAT